MAFDKLKNLLVSSLLLMSLILLLNGCSEEPETTVTFTMNVEPSSMDRETVVDRNPDVQAVHVTSPSGHTIKFSATSQESWVRMNLYGGGQVVDRAAPDSFVISISSRTLDAGFYTDTVWITANNVSNSPYAIPVTLLVGDSLEYSPLDINFNAITFRGSPESQSLNVTSTSGEGLDFSLTKKESWLLIPDPTGVVPKDVVVGVNSAGLTPGYYYDTITIDAPLAVNSPEIVPCSLSVFSWEKVDYTNSANTSLDAIYFIDELHGWAVGSVDNFIKTGFIVATDDGGDTWDVQELSVENIIGDVLFLDQNNGFVSGGGGLIWKTSDGGDNWVSKNTPTTNDLPSIFFIDSNNGWACGDEGVILHSDDGGETWESQTTSITFDLSAIYFISLDSGWVVGNGGTILSTSDGGVNWASQITPDFSGYKDIFFIDNAEGWACGDLGTILHTTNSGNTWVQLSTGLNIEYLSISFCICGQGWIVGNNGSILYSSDGITWVDQLSGTNTNLQSIFMITNNKGWAVGHGGLLLYTEVGGH